MSSLIPEKICKEMKEGSPDSKSLHATSDKQKKKKLS